MSEHTNATQPSPRDSLVTVAHIVYLLHTLSLLLCATSLLTIMGAFVFGIPSLVAVILNYANQHDARGTFLESHFRWQIRTFWFAALLVLATLFLILTILGIPLAWLLAIGSGLWVIYRIARGWLALAGRRPIMPLAAAAMPD